MRILHQLHIKGFKSIRDQKLVFNPLNVFIGSNGSGKSNLVGTFHLLNRVSNQQLQVYTGESGGANAILHFGEITEKYILKSSSHRDKESYEFELKPTDEDRSFFLVKKYFQDTVKYKSLIDEALTAMLKLNSPSRRDTSKDIREHLNSYRIYHFTTRASARMKQSGDGPITDIFALTPETSQRSFYRLQEKEPDLLPRHRGYGDNTIFWVRHFRP
jgi:predicted ATPase